MGKNKRKAPASFYVHSAHTAPNLTVGLSDDGRRVRLRQTHTAKLPLPTIEEESEDQNSTPNLPLDAVPHNDNAFELEGVVHQIEFSDSITGFRVLTKAKAKRYENSVSSRSYRSAIATERLLDRTRR